MRLKESIHGHSFGIRRSGRTTKIVNGLIEDFFTTGIADCYDHHPTNEMHEYVMKAVLKRLGYEFNFPKEEIIIDKQRIILVNKLIPTAVKKYCELKITT